jgi:hypothetical protein
MSPVELVRPDHNDLRQDYGIRRSRPSMVSSSNAHLSWGHGLCELSVSFNSFQLTNSSLVAERTRAEGREVGITQPRADTNIDLVSFPHGIVVISFDTHTSIRILFQTMVTEFLAGSIGITIVRMKPPCLRLP